MLPDDAFDAVVHPARLAGVHPSLELPLEYEITNVIGNKGDTPNSSDGVVEYWSSRIPNADSELIVPGPHGSQSLPETMAELHRILHLHLKHFTARN